MINYCGTCPHNGNVILTSYPPRIRCELTGEYHYTNDACNVDMVAVVRCKDCKWCDITDYGAGEVLECILDRLYRINSISLEGETYFREVEPDDFCAWGERKEDAEIH